MKRGFYDKLILFSIIGICMFAIGWMPFLSIIPWNSNNTWFGSSGSNKNMVIEKVLNGIDVDGTGEIRSVVMPMYNHESFGIGWKLTEESGESNDLALKIRYSMNYDEKDGSGDFGGTETITASITDDGHFDLERVTPAPCGWSKITVEGNATNPTSDSTLDVWRAFQD